MDIFVDERDFKLCTANDDGTYEGVVSGSSDESYYYKYMSYAKCMSQRELREAYVELMIELEEIRLKEKYGK